MKERRRRGRDKRGVNDTYITRKKKTDETRIKNDEKEKQRNEIVRATEERRGENDTKNGKIRSDQKRK